MINIHVRCLMLIMPEYIADEFLTKKIQYGIILTTKDFMPQNTDN